MYISRFIVRNLFGYLSLDINYIQGVNGTGKTSALKLMNALLAPNFIDLYEIPFSIAELHISSENESCIIKAEQDEGELTLSTPHTGHTWVVEPILREELDVISHEGHSAEELTSDIVRRYAHEPVVKEISRLPTPIFLGIDRRRSHSNNGVPPKVGPVL